METQNQTPKLGRKDLATILQNHKAEALKSSDAKLKELPSKIDTGWFSPEYDAYKIPGVCIISQIRVSDYQQMLDSHSNLLVTGRNIETSVYLHDSNDNKYHLVEFSREETPEKAYDSLIKRLEENNN